MTERLLAVIPARARSKRVPGKNTRVLAGRPAIAYTIDAAVASGLFDRIIVSTDSEEIAHIALSCGAEAPFRREAALADDHTPVSDVTLDALDRIEKSAGEKFDAVCQLMANCPLRTSEDISSSYEQFQRTRKAQISVTKYGWLNPWWAVEIAEGYRITHVHPESLGKRSQDLPDVYCPSGAIWWAMSDVLRRQRTFHTSDKTGWEIPWYRAIDIDSEDDWRMAEVLLELSGRKAE